MDLFEQVNLTLCLNLNLILKFLICKKDTTNADDERRCLRRKTYRGIHGTEQIFKKNKIYVAQIQRPKPCSTEPNHYQQTMDHILA